MVFQPSVDPSALYVFFREQAHSLLPGNFAFDNMAGTSVLLEKLKNKKFSEHKRNQWWKDSMYEVCGDHVIIHYSEADLYYYPVFDAVIIEKSDEKAAAEALITELQVVGQN